MFYSQRWPLQFIGPTDDGSRGQVPGSDVSGRCKKSDEHFGQCGMVHQWKQYRRGESICQKFRKFLRSIIVIRFFTHAQTRQ